MTAARATLVDGINALLTRLCGITARTVHDGGPSLSEGNAPYTMPGRTSEADLSWVIFSERSLGVDETQITYDPTLYPEVDTYAGPGAPLGSVVYKAQGQRQITFQVDCESLQWEKDGHYYLSRLQARLRLPSAVDELNALGLGLCHVGDIVNVGKGASVDGHATSRYSLEFVCNAADIVDDDPITTIEVVHTAVTVTT
jgi:hypothetical protein